MERQLGGINISLNFNDKLPSSPQRWKRRGAAAAKGLGAQRGVLMGDSNSVAFSLKSPVGKVVENGGR